MMRRIAAITLLALYAAACGRVAPLRPAQGQPLPVKPAMAPTTPTPDELLAATPMAHPERIDELMKRSEPRRADRFDLPPPAGGAAPAPPTEPETPTNQVEPSPR